MIDWWNPTATLIASFSGAWAAFTLQSNREKKAQDRQNISAANRALMTLMRQTNDLKLFQTDQLNPHRDNRGRHLAILPTLPFDEAALRIDFSSLSFLDTKREFQVLFELSIEERRYIETIKAINARSRLLLDSVQPILAASGLAERVAHSRSDFVRALGEPQLNYLERLTDQVYFHVDRTIETLCKMRDAFRAALIHRYPAADFLNFELPATTSAV